MKKFLTLTTILCSSWFLSSCAHECEGNFTGENCEQCSGNWSGSNCDIGPSCVNGTANIGLTGDGHCSDCSSDWSGINCDIANECQNGDGNIGISGDGHCLPDSCSDGFTDINCDQCATGYFGQHCQPVTCKNGVANDGKNGDGHCSECTENYWGIDCDKIPTCINGEANIGINGDGHCSECSSNYWGIDCDKVPTCVNGEASIGINGDGHCTVCTDSHFTGANCDQCAENTYGSDCKLYGSVTDQDGNTYKTVIINGQEWMAENYRRETGTYYYPNNSSSNKDTYGLLYPWATATSSNFCPSGWHLPTGQEFADLLTYVANNSTSSSDFLALIAKSTVWTDYSNHGGDDFGFGGLPAGIYHAGNYYYFGYSDYFWSSTEADSSYANSLCLGYGYADVGNFSKTYGFSVRCLKD